VNSKEFNGYVRTKRPDGAFQTETFAFGNGGILPGLVMRDPTFDCLTFQDIARLLAGPLARQNYLAAHEAKSTNLLIMVYWGTTLGAVHTLWGPAQDALNYRNASLLGFETEAHFLGESPADSARGWIIRDLHASGMSAIEVNRYYVILRAFDFQSAWKQKKLKLLWETRFSLSERHHGFKQDLPAMAESASLYFGQDSYGLVRTPPIREGHIHLGEPKVLSVVDDEANQRAAESSAALASMIGDWQDTSRGRSPVILHIGQKGNAAFENPDQHAVLSARVSVDGHSVTMRVPGWDISFRGTRDGNRISGVISEYGATGRLNLEKTPGPIGDGHLAVEDARPPGDVPKQSSPTPSFGPSYPPLPRAGRSGD